MTMLSHIYIIGTSSALWCFPDYVLHGIFDVAEGDKLTQAQSLLDSACSVVYWDKSAADLEAAFYNLKAHHPLVMRETD